MAKIIAKGKKDGSELTVECWETDEGLKITFNGKTFEPYEKDFWREMEVGYVMAQPSYIAEPGSIRRATNVLYYHFFDDKPSEFIEEGDFKWPEWDPDLVY